MKIQVTADHIRHGVRENPVSCPVALATAEALGTKVWAFGHFFFLGATSLPTLERRPFPPIVATRVGIFDRSGHMEPFEFEITDP